MHSEWNPSCTEVNEMFPIGFNVPRISLDVYSRQKANPVHEIWELLACRDIYRKLKFYGDLLLGTGDYHGWVGLKRVIIISYRTFTCTRQSIIRKS